MSDVIDLTLAADSAPNSRAGSEQPLEDIAHTLLHVAIATVPEQRFREIIAGLVDRVPAIARAVFDEFSVADLQFPENEPNQQLQRVLPAQQYAPVQNHVPLQPYAALQPYAPIRPYVPLQPYYAPFQQQYAPFQQQYAPFQQRALFQAYAPLQACHIPAQPHPPILPYVPVQPRAPVQPYAHIQQHRPVPKNVPVQEPVPQWEVCVNCDDEYDAIEERANGECAYHTGRLKAVEKRFVDHYEEADGPIDTPSNRREFPENFSWTCCHEDGRDKGCRVGRHEPGGMRRRRQRRR